MPVCEQGTIELTVKNTSAQADEFRFVVTDTIRNATFVSQTAFVTVTNVDGSIVTGTTSGALLANIPFTPTVISTTNVQTLTWNILSFAVGTPAYDALAQRAAADQLLIRFRLQTDCSSNPVRVQSIGQALDSCQVPLSFTESSKALITDIPVLEVTKQVRNASIGGAFGTSSSLPARARRWSGR